MIDASFSSCSWNIPANGTTCIPISRWEMSELPPWARCTGLASLACEGLAVSVISSQKGVHRLHFEFEEWCELRFLRIETSIKCLDSNYM